MKLLSILTFLSATFAVYARDHPEDGPHRGDALTTKEDNCEPTATVITKTVTTTTSYLTTITAKATHSCYTESITVFSTNIRCSQFNTSSCPLINCLRAETKTIPCKDKCCPTTTTETSYRGCQTACEPSCPTITVSCSKTL